MRIIEINMKDVDKLVILYHKLTLRVMKGIGEI
jgi:hypothetical protein